MTKQGGFVTNFQDQISHDDVDFSLRQGRCCLGCVGAGLNCVTAISQNPGKEFANMLVGLGY